MPSCMGNPWLTHMNWLYELIVLLLLPHRAAAIIVWLMVKNTNISSYLLTKCCEFISLSWDTHQVLQNKMKSSVSSKQGNAETWCISEFSTCAIHWKMKCQHSLLFQLLLKYPLIPLFETCFKLDFFCNLSTSNSATWQTSHIWGCPRAAQMPL